jgi:hypothetical protein
MTDLPIAITLDHDGFIRSMAILVQRSWISPYVTQGWHHIVLWDLSILVHHSHYNKMSVISLTRVQAAVVVASVQRGHALDMGLRQAPHLWPYHEQSI